MQIERYFIAAITGVLAASAWAQSPPQVLNLNLPPASATAKAAHAVPAKNTSKVGFAAVTTEAVTSIPPASQNPTQPGRHYDANDNASVDAADSRARGCNDASYTKAQVHGDIGLGVVAGDHLSGSYQTGRVNVTKALGSCDHPTGEVSLSVDVGQGNFNGRDYRRH